MITVSRIFDILQRQKTLFPKPDSLLSKVNGKWTPVSTEDFIINAEKFGQGLLKKGLGKGEKVAIISANRPEWNIIDMGMLQAGIINVPIYTTLSESEIIFILNDCGAKLVFAGD